MNENAIRERVKTILREILNLEIIKENASQDMYPEWDSMTYLSILSSLEDEFALSITEANINSFDSLPHIVAQIQEAQKHAAK